MINKIYIYIVYIHFTSQKAPNVFYRSVVTRWVVWLSLFEAAVRCVWMSRSHTVFPISDFHVAVDSFVIIMLEHSVNWCSVWRVCVIVHPLENMSFVCVSETRCVWAPSGFGGRFFRVESAHKRLLPVLLAYDCWKYEETAACLDTKGDLMYGQKVLVLCQRAWGENVSSRLQHQRRVCEDQVQQISTKLTLDFVEPSLGREQPNLTLHS